MADQATGKRLVHPFLIGRLPTMALGERRAHRPRRRWFVALTLLAVAIAPVAHADEKSPSRHDVQKARAAVAARESDVAAVEAQLAAANQRLQLAAAEAEQASEAYNGAQWALQQAREEARQAELRASAAERQVEKQRQRIVVLVTENYEGAGQLSAVGAMFSSDGPSTLMSQYLSYEGASGALQSGYAEFAAASAVAESFRQQAEDARAEQVKLAGQAKEALQRAKAAANSAQEIARATATRKAQLVQELAKARGISVKLAQERQKALEEKAQQEAAAAAAAAAKKAAQEKKKQQQQQQDDTTTPSDDNIPPPPVSSNPPPPRSGAQRAIDFAKAQLGDPYQWGAAGPDKWDCSGLTMMAWNDGGVALPHYSVAQYYASTPISVTDLRPGDLVFWGTSNDPNSIHHVALYIGNGQIIHAPRTGENVRIDSMYYWIPPNFFGRV